MDRISAIGLRRPGSLGKVWEWVMGGLMFDTEVLLSFKKKL